MFGHRKQAEEPAFDFEDGLAFGEWLHRALMEAVGVETEPWAREQVRRVERQLHVKRAPAARLTPEVLWLPEATAFTAPGRYVYLSRELQQRAACDDPVAFVLAHEMAHHDLGHLDFFGGRWAALRHAPAGVDVVLLMRAAEKLFMGPERESAADARALDLCLTAGYDGRRCLEAFEILEAYALDHHDLDMVFGPDEPLRDGAAGVRRWVEQAKVWGWQRLRGYPAIRERKSAVLERMGIAPTTWPAHVPHMG